MNENEKRFDAAMDLVQWLDARITQQVQHQLEQRLAQEGEYWRCDVVDLIAEERERMNALLRDVHKDIVDLTRENNERPLDRVDQIFKQSDKTIVEMCTGVDRIEAKLDPIAVPTMMARSRLRSNKRSDSHGGGG